MHYTQRAMVHDGYVDDVVDVVDDDLVDLSRDLFFASILMARLFGSCNADLFFVRVVLAFITCGFTSCLLEDALLMFFVTTGAIGIQWCWAMAISQLIL